MALLSWGKPGIETTTSTDGAPGAAAAWREIDTPKENTTKLTPTAGTSTEAIEEGGDIVDFRTGKTKFQLEFDLFVKKGKKRPWDDEDGIIEGEHAFRITPEDEDCEGIQIDRCKLRVEESYATAEGKMLHYVAQILKPKNGKKVKPYFKNAPKN